MTWQNFFVLFFTEIRSVSLITERIASLWWFWFLCFFCKREKLKPLFLFLFLRLTEFETYWYIWKWYYIGLVGGWSTCRWLIDNDRIYLLSFALGWTLVLRTSYMHHPGCCGCRLEDWGKGKYNATSSLVYMSKICTFCGPKFCQCVIKWSQTNIFSKA